MSTSDCYVKSPVAIYRIFEVPRLGAKLMQTEVDDVPMALMAFQGRLVAGVGKALRIYEIGKKKLLRKGREQRMCLASLHAPLVECVSAQTFGSAIVSLNTQGSRIIVGDMQESVHFTVYKQPENRLLIFADDSQPRWTTATVMVDYTMIAVGDKFGNIFVNRLDLKVSDQVDEDPTGAGILHEKSILMGSPHGTMLLARYHVGDIVTGLHKVSLVAGGREVMLFTCLHGTIGILMLFVSKEDVSVHPDA